MASARTVGLAAHLRLRLLGLLLVVSTLGFLALTVLFYRHTFTPTVPVTLQAESIGNQLIVPADVRFHGVTVGTVTSVQSNGRVASLHLAMDPAHIDAIPANVTAQIIPETLFGEKYVSLVYPQHPSAQHITAGAVIGVDRSKTALELDRVFNQLVPLLKTLQPEQLNLTLSAVAQALSGRGEELGQNLVLADQYFRQFNPHLPTFEHDIRALATYASSLNVSLPGLFDQFRNFSANARLITGDATTYDQFLKGTVPFANAATAFFQADGKQMIAIGPVSEPVTSVLAYYSPEFTCLLNGLSNLENRLQPDFGPGPYLHITLEYVPDRGPYTYPQDLPQYNTVTAPNCYGLPNNPNSTNYPGVYTAAPAANSTRTSQQSLGIGAVGSPGEQQLVAGLLAPVMRVQSGKVNASLADLLAGPMLRGMVVSLK